MAKKSFSAKPATIKQIVIDCARDYNGTTACRGIVATRIAAFAEARTRTDSEIQEIINASAVLVEAGILTPHDFLGLIIPFHYTNDDMLRLSVLGRIWGNVLALDHAGHVLGTHPVDNIVFKTIAALYEKLLGEPGEADPKRPTPVQQAADGFYASLFGKKHDDALLSLIEPFTSYSQSGRRAKPLTAQPASLRS